MSHLTVLDYYLQSCKDLKIRKPNKHVQAAMAVAGDKFESVDNIDCSNTYVGPRGILAIARLLPFFVNLRVLNLDNQFMFNADDRPTAVTGNETIKSLVDLLMPHRALSTLSLRNNDIATEAFGYIMMLVSRKESWNVLCEVCLEGTRVEPADIASLESICEARRIKLQQKNAEKKKGQQYTVYSPLCSISDVVLPAMSFVTVAAASMLKAGSGAGDGFRAIQKTPAREEAVAAAIERHPVLRRMTPEHKSMFIKCAYYCDIRKEEIFIEAGDEPEGYYVTVSGNVDCITADGTVTTFGPGCTFGENALMNGDELRNATCRANAATDVVAYGVDRGVFDAMVRPFLAAGRFGKTGVTYISTIPSLARLPMYARTTLCDGFQHTTLNPMSISTPEFTQDVVILVVEGKGTAVRNNVDLLRGDIVILMASAQPNNNVLAAHEQGLQYLSVPLADLDVLHPTLYPSLTKSARILK
eukprot:PhF_6_TR28331/c0_g1_i1/m.41980/K04739/PRKAR; cAMP-dependent protein kinase regulator